MFYPFTDFANTEIKFYPGSYYCVLSATILHATILPHGFSDDLLMESNYLQFMVIHLKLFSGYIQIEYIISHFEYSSKWLHCDIRNLQHFILDIIIIKLGWNSLSFLLVNCRWLLPVPWLHLELIYPSLQPWGLWLYSLCSK